MQSIRNILHKQTSYPYTTTRTSAKANSSRKLIPVLWKKLLQTHGTAMGTKMEVAFSNFISPLVRESKTLLDSGFHAVDSGFQLLDSRSFSVELGFQIRIVRGIPDSYTCIPDSKAQDSGFQMQKFPGFRNPDSFTWCDSFMNKVETEILSQSELKPLVWTRFIEDIFSL